MSKMAEEAKRVEDINQHFAYTSMLEARVVKLEVALREILHISREILTHGDPYDVERIARAALDDVGKLP